MPATTNPIRRSESAILQAAHEILDQAIAAIEILDDARYTHPVTAASGASLGAHLRHCLDHFGSFLAGTDDTRIDYDLRERDPLLECDRFAALNRSREVQCSLERLRPELLSRPVTVCSKIRYTGDFSQTAESTFEREPM